MDMKLLDHDDAMQHCEGHDSFAIKIIGGIVNL